ncbi:FAD-binding oxidoreductase [Chloroflexota bacterium]
MNLKTDLAGIVGSEHVSNDADVLEKYSKDYSFVKARRPSCVAFPQNTEEVQELVKYANLNRVPVTPRSSPVGFYGAGIPGEGGIIADLTRMNRILEIDGLDRKVRVEPGVTWEQVQEELEKHGMMVCNPLLPHRSKSVLTSAMEREPILIPKYEYNETFLTAEMVLPGGEMFWTGTAIGKGHVGKCNPEGVIPSTRLFLGSQGTLGIATWANLKTVYIPAIDELLFLPFNNIEDLITPLYQILRIRIGSECFVLNGSNLAAMIAEDDKDIDAIKEDLPQWAIVLCLSGLNRHPEKKLAYEKEALMNIAEREQFEVCDTLGGISGLKETVLKLIRKPWKNDTYWKFRPKGLSQDIFFHTTLDKVGEFTRAINGVASKYRYPAADIGFYLQPKEQGRVGYCQYSFNYDPDNTKDVSTVHDLYLEASQLAINMGGLFSNPYGAWADMVYSRAATYTTVLKQVKDVFDPNRIMNPGKLCY